MSYKIESLPDEPIIILHMLEDFDFETELVKVSVEAEQLFELLEEPVFWVVNIKIKMDVGALLAGTQEATQNQGFGWRHPKMREVLLISDQLLLQVAAPGYSAEQFGGVNVNAFQTLEEGLVYCRSK